MSDESHIGEPPVSNESVKANEASASGDPFKIIEYVNFNNGKTVAYGVRGPDGKEKIGYGKPPKRHQYKKGQSGNPKGRPRINSVPKEIIPRLMSEKVKIKTPKGMRTVSMTEAILWQLMVKAAQGDTKAIAMWFKLIEPYKEKLAPYLMVMDKSDLEILVGELPQLPRRD